MILTSPQEPAHAGLARSLALRPGIGAAAHIVQQNGLEIVRLHISAPVLILVRRGVKTVRCGTTLQARALPGQAIALAGGQTVDISNVVTGSSRYEAQWLAFDDTLVADFAAARADLGMRPEARRKAWSLPHLASGLLAAFDCAHTGLAADSGLPDAVVRHRMQEVLLWMALEGGLFESAPPPTRIDTRVRALLAGRLDCDWPAAKIARELALSEATLRRRLADEGLGLGELLVDARMSFALTLLQATTRSIADIAQAVGYASASRFALRFRQRFGFAPSVLRGHERAGPPQGEYRSTQCGG